MKSKAKISEVMEFISGSEQGSGYWGFVVTYPDGHIENYTYEYTKECRLSQYHVAASQRLDKLTNVKSIHLGKAQGNSRN